MLCTHKTASSASLVLEICPQFNNSFLHQFSSIFGGNCIRLTVSSLDSQANRSNQSSIQRELLMPSPEVINLTLSDDEIQPDPIRSDQGTPTPIQATNWFRTSSTIPLTSGINKPVQNKFCNTSHIWHQQNSKDSSSHSRYFCSHRTS